MATRLTGTNCDISDIMFNTQNWIYIDGALEISYKLDPKFITSLTDREFAEYICDELGVYNFRYIKTNDRLTFGESLWCTLTDRDLDILSSYIFKEYGVSLCYKVKNVKLYTIDMRLYEFKHKVKCNILESMTDSLRIG